MRRGALCLSSAALVAGAVAAVAAVAGAMFAGAVALSVVAMPAGAVAASAVVAAQPRHPVFLIYDGFIRNADGSLTLAFGYHNVNRVEVTVAGDDNAFLPGTTDRNQPTEFLPGRQRFACVMVVPEDFDGRLQWRVRFAGHESVTTARVLNPLYALEEASARQAVEGIDVDGALRGACLERRDTSERQ